MLVGKSQTTSRGFTIVELLIVIVVIGILAGLIITAYNGIQQRAMTTSLQADLRNAVVALEQAKIDNGDVYPTVFPSYFKTNSKVTLNLAVTGDPYTYCINGTYNGLSQPWKIDKASGGLQQGSCSGQVIVGSDVSGNGTKVNYVADPNFGSGWALTKASGSSSVTTRSGTASDPSGNRPVLIIQNNAAATSWAYIGGGMNATTMTSGKSYTTSYWIRVTTGTFSGNIGAAGVMDGSATNRVLNGTTGSGISSSWQKISVTQTALINGLASSKFYIYTNTPAMSQSFTIELQDPRVEET